MKDRGAKKWSAMMLPEHKKLLEKMYQEQGNVKKPILDPDKCEEINAVLLLAINGGRQIRFKVYQENHFRFIEGVIKKYISSERKIKIIAGLDKIVFLHLEQIIDAEII
ncbi:MAG: hypothetical protein VR72_02060 [Clostridiaceae bacterium BRH_c20a]|nr:MAG: hypothetical protein VR72_02060 [Clostridiaceae bacterium BRH_c20a]